MHTKLPKGLDDIQIIKYISLIKLAKLQVRSIANLVSTFEHAIQILFTVYNNFALRIQ